MRYVSILQIGDWKDKGKITMEVRVISKKILQILSNCMEFTPLGAFEFNLVIQWSSNFFLFTYLASNHPNFHCNFPLSSQSPICNIATFLTKSTCYIYFIFDWSNAHFGHYSN